MTIDQDTKKDLEFNSFEDLSPFHVDENLTFGKCRFVGEFEKLDQIGQGTYGVVYRARDSKTGKIYALKRMKISDQHSMQGFPLSSIREIQTLKLLSHPNIIKLETVAVGRQLQNIFLVMEFCEQELATMIDQKVLFTESQIKCLMQQLLRGVDYMHKSFVVHRDLKPSNLLLTEKGVLKIADFGLARKFGPISTLMSPQVVTLWYRAPEILFEFYPASQARPTAIDMWAIGCIFGELLLKKPLLPGKSEIDQIGKIIDLLGTPNDQIWPGFSSLPISQSFDFKHQPYNNVSHILKFVSDAGIRLINWLLMYDPKKRAKADDALDSSYFKEVPLPCEAEGLPMIPRFV